MKRRANTIQGGDDAGRRFIATARQLFDRAAGATEPIALVQQFTLRGCVDKVGPGVIEGWAQNVDHPEAPVCLDIYVGDRIIGQTLANCYRKDLEHAGLGSGRHSFLFVPPKGADISSDVIQIRRSLDGVTIACSKPVNDHARAA